MKCLCADKPYTESADCYGGSKGRQERMTSVGGVQMNETLFLTRVFETHQMEASQECIFVCNN